MGYYKIMFYLKSQEKPNMFTENKEDFTNSVTHGVEIQHGSEIVRV